MNPHAPSPAAAGDSAPPVPATAAAAPAASPSPPVPRWHYHRRLYDWVLSLAHSRHALTALFLLSFAESSFFPIPPDVLQIALTLERRSRAWLYAAVSTVASVLGGVFGWMIGAVLWGAVGGFFMEYIPGVNEKNFALVHDKFEANAFLAIFTAAFTPIPYKVFTIAAGVFDISLITLVVGSIVGRGARFFLVAAVFWKFGPPAKAFVEKYFNLLTLLFTAALVGGFIVVGMMADRDKAPAPAPAAPPATASPGAPGPAPAP